LSEKKSSLSNLEFLFAVVAVFIISFILVGIFALIIVPLIIQAPFMIVWLFVFISDSIATPLFDKLTPLGTILFLILIIVIILALARRPNVKASASYLPGLGAIYSLIYYLRKEEDEFVKFHATQGLILFAIASLLFMASIFFLNLGMQTIANLIFFILFIAGGLLLIYMMVTAYQGKKVKLF
jgi:uncharacterized membrane protein